MKFQDQDIPNWKFPSKPAKSLEEKNGSNNNKQLQHKDFP